MVEVVGLVVAVVGGLGTGSVVLEDVVSGALVALVDSSRGFVVLKAVGV